MSIPDYQSLMLPLLRRAATGASRIPEAADLIADEVGLTEEERDALLPSGTQRVLHNRLHWAKFYMTKAGLMQSPKRGVFVATDLGLALLASSPASLDVEKLKAYPSFVEWYAKSNDQTAVDKAVTSHKIETLPSTPEEQIGTAANILQSALAADLLLRIAGQSPAFFERVIVDLLVAMGYGGTHERAARVIGKSGDGGIDGVIDEDRLGLDRVYVQAKRYAPHVTVGRPDIQSFVGSLVGQGATKGVFVTTSVFSGAAHDFVLHLPQRIVLIDGSRLANLLIEHGVGVRVAQQVIIKKIDEDFFVDE